MSTRSDQSSRFSAFHHPRNPNAAFVKERHRQRHRDESQKIRGWRNDRGQNENEHDGIGSGAGHEFVSDQTEINQGEHNDRQLKGQTEAENKFGYERIILLHRPRWRPTQRLGVAKKEEDRFRKNPVIADQHAKQKKTEAA